MTSSAPSSISLEFVQSGFSELAWKPDTRDESIKSWVADLASAERKWDHKTLFSVVNALTIDSEEFTEELTNYLVSQVEDFRPTFEYIAKNADNRKSVNQRGEALVPFESAITRLITTQISSWGLASLNARLDDNNKLTNLEARILPILFTGEIQDGLAGDRRDIWKDLKDDDMRVNYLHNILFAIRFPLEHYYDKLTVAECEQGRNLEEVMASRASLPFNPEVPGQ